MYIIMFYYLTSDTDPTGQRRLLRTQGKLVNFTGRKPLICWGRKNPISHLSRMKNPGLPLFVVIILYFFIIDSSSANAITVLLKSTKLTILI